MSDLYLTIESFNLQNLSDSDSEDTKNGSSDSQEISEMSERMEKSGRQPLPLGNITIESPTNFAVNIDTKNGSSAGKHPDAVHINDGDPRTGALKSQYVNNRSVSFIQQEKLAKGDSQLSTSPQRKLPIPNAAMNTNPNLKGILIKPKRILPAQPDLMKAKSAQIRPSAKTEDKLDQGLTLSGDVVSQEQIVGGDSDEKQTSKFPLDVQKIKTFFAKNGAELIKTKTNANNETKVTIDSEHSDSYAQRSQDDCGIKPEGYLVREQTIYDFNETENMSKNPECASSEKELNINPMTTETTVTRSSERGIRSPSPKSNTTWDRSSSGYSSDERPDPRSPPPVSSAGTSSKHSLDNDDENLVSEIETAVAKLAAADELLGPDTGQDIQNLDFLNTDSAISGKENLSLVCSHTVTGGVSVTPQPPKCNCDIIPKTKTDLGPQTITSAFESVTPGSRQQPVQKPVWTLPNKIQYRKSGSEPAISLRHSVRQCAAETHEGLEVLGKSYRQQSSVTILSSHGERETDGRSEIPTPGGKDSQAGGATELDLTLNLSQVEARGQDAAKTQILRPQLMTLKSPRDMKNMGMNVGLSTPKDEKDIRKSLHDLNSPKRRSPAMKAVPIRARHTIHVAQPNMPISDAVTKTSETDTKPGIKLFSKKMWRAPSGQPDGPENRPFSPFGGTLPPAKINEKKKKAHEFMM